LSKEKKNKQKKRPNKDIACVVMEDETGKGGEAKRNQSIYNLERLLGKKERRTSAKLAAGNNLRFS